MQIEILKFKYGEMLVTAIGQVTQESEDSLFVAHKLVMVGGGKVAPVGEWFRKETLFSRLPIKDMPTPIAQVLTDIDKMTVEEADELYKMWAAQWRRVIASKNKTMTHSKILELKEVMTWNTLGAFLVEAIGEKRRKESNVSIKG